MGEWRNILLKIMNTILKITLLLAITFNLSCNANKAEQAKNQYKYWSDLNKDEKAAILKSENINKDALHYYKGEFKLSDKKESITLLGTLTDITGNKAPFYFYLFNKACEEADGALSEVFGRYCQEIILSSPVYVLNYLGENEPLLKKYADYLGYELYFKEDGTSSIKYSYEEFKEILSNNISDGEHLKETLSLFYNYIDVAMNRMD